MKILEKTEVIKKLGKKTEKTGKSLNNQERGKKNKNREIIKKKERRG